MVGGGGWIYIKSISPQITVGPLPPDRAIYLASTGPLPIKMTTILGLFDDYITCIQATIIKYTIFLIYFILCIFFLILYLS